jgi:hypothetical protein
MDSSKSWLPYVHLDKHPRTRCTMAQMVLSTLGGDMLDLNIGFVLALICFALGMVVDHVFFT